MSSRERKFLHDIANPIMTLKILVNNLQEGLSNEHSPLPQFKVLDRLGKCEELLEKLEVLHAECREKIILEQKELEGKGKRKAA